MKLPYAGVYIKQGGTLVPAAEYGAAGAGAAPVAVRLPLAAQGETVGELRLHLRVGERELGAADRRLLDDLSRQAGIAIQATRLTGELRSLSEDLQQSRERLVSTREEERRRLRRDLHDGLGPALASLALKVDAARNLLQRNPERADTLLASVGEQLQATISDIRRLVYELRPPALDQLGLAAALRQYAAQLPGETNIMVDVPDRLPALLSAKTVRNYVSSILGKLEVADRAEARAAARAAGLGRD